MTKKSESAPIDYETLKRRKYVQIFRECYDDTEGLDLAERQQYVWAVGYYGFFGKIPEGISPIVKFALLQRKHSLDTSINKTVAALKREEEERRERAAADAAHLETERAAKEARKTTPPEPQPQPQPPQQAQNGQPYRVPDGPSPYYPFPQTDK